MLKTLAQATLKKSRVSPCRRLSLTALSVALILALSACGSEAGSTQSGVPLVKSGQVTVCSDTSYEPYEFNRDGRFIGFDIDLSHEIAKDLGVPDDIITTSFEGIQSSVALNSNQCDIGISGITVTDERRSKMDFSENYASDNLGLLVVSSSGIASLEETSGKPIGVQVATTGEKYLREHSPDADAQQFETAGDMMTALKSGRVDAILGSINVLNWTSKGDDGLKVVQEYKTGEALGMAVKKGNTKMLEAVNATLSRIKKDGRYDAMVKEWLSG